MRGLPAVNLHLCKYYNYRSSLYTHEHGDGCSKKEIVDDSSTTWSDGSAIINKRECWGCPYYENSTPEEDNNMSEIKAMKDGREVTMAHNGIVNLRDAVYNQGKCLTCKWRGSTQGIADEPKIELCYCRKLNVSKDINNQDCPNYEQMTPEEFGEFIRHEQSFKYKKILETRVLDEQSEKFVGYKGTDQIEKITIIADPGTSRLIQAYLSKIKEAVDDYNREKLYNPLFACMMLIEGTSKYIKEKYRILYDKLLGN